MNCQTVQDKLVEYLLLELNECDDQAINEHLRSGCAACNAELAELSHALNAMLEPDNAPSLSGEVQAEIVASVIARGKHLTSAVKASIFTLPADAAPEKIPTDLRQKQFNVGVLLYPACFAVGLLLALTLWGFNAEENREEESQFALFNHPLPANSNESEGEVSRSTVVFTSLTAHGAQSVGAWQAVYDPYSRELHFFCHDLPTPANGSEYVICTIRQSGESTALQAIELDPLGCGRAIVRDISLQDASTIDIKLQQSPDGVSTNQSSLENEAIES